MKSEEFYKRREQSQTRLAFAESRRKMGKANLLPRDLHLQQLYQSVSLIVQRYNIPTPPIVHIMRTHTLRCDKYKNQLFQGKKRDNDGIWQKMCIFAAVY